MFILYCDFEIVDIEKIILKFYGLVKVVGLLFLLSPFFMFEILC